MCWSGNAVGLGVDEDEEAAACLGELSDDAAHLGKITSVERME
jgi:hypothetical protein